MSMLKHINLFSKSKRDFFYTFNRQELLSMVLKGAVIGIFSGFVGATFRYVIHWANDFRHTIISIGSYEALLYWLIAMFCAGWICHFLLRWAPLSGGSGIPQIEGEMKGIFSMQPIPTLISKYVGGILTGLVGFSVGREGPSVQLGGAMGKFLSQRFGSSLREERILTSAGAAAGLTAAFSSPVSGAIFVFEEVHKSFYPKLIIPTFTATIWANFITSWIFGLSPSLGFTVMESIPIQYFFNLVLLGIFVGFVGVLFNRLILLVKTWFDTVLISRGWKISATFVLVTLLGYDSQLLLGGGNDVVNAMIDSMPSLLMLTYILIGKIILTAICYGTGAQGGIFLPMVVIGSAAGGFMHSVLVEVNMLPFAFSHSFIICGMAGMLASSMRTPLLSILLVLEMTNSFHSIYQVGTVAIMAFLTAEFLKEIPIYDNLLSRMVQDTNTIGREQTFFQTRITVVSPLIGKALKDIQMPKGSFLVTIERCGQSIIPMASTVLASGDELYVSCERGQLQEIKEFFEEEMPNS